METLDPLLTITASAVLSAFTGWFSSRVNLQSQLNFNANKFRAAIAAELRMLHGRLLLYEEIFAARVMTGKMPGHKVAETLFQNHDMAVFLDNASAIGWLDGRLALEILRFYADLRSLKGRAALLSEIAEAFSRPVEEEERFHLERIRRVRRRAHRLIARLRRRQSGWRPSARSLRKPRRESRP